jgi:uncharacterized membrane protein YesL
MMDRIFNLDNPVMRFLGRAFDMMMLNILFIVCSLPIFTIGASLSALHYSCLKMKDENEGYVFRNFFRSFKMNFKQGTGMWLIMLALGLLLFMENRMAAQITDASVRPIRIMIYVAGSLWYMALCWMFALQSRFVNKVGQTIKNAVLLTFAKAPRSIGMLGVLALELIFVARSSGLVQSYAILYLLMFGFSVQVLINTQLQYPVIRELMPNDEDDKPAADNQFTVDEEADVSALGYTPLPKDEKKPGADNPGTGE